MKEVTITYQKCEYCGFKSESAPLVENHEKQCKYEYLRAKRAEEEQAARVKTAQNRAIELSKNDPAMVLLMQHGLEDAAGSRAKTIYDSEVFYDFGSGYLYEATIRMMLDCHRDILPTNTNAHEA